MFALPIKKNKREKLNFQSYLPLICSVAVIGLFYLSPETRALAASSETNNPPLVFATPSEEGVFTLYLREVFKELGNRVGLNLEIEELPKKRALVAANMGEYDGLAARIKGLEKLGLPNLRGLGVSHFTVQHVLFSRRTAIQDNVTDIQSLIELATKWEFKVAFLRGSKKALLLLADLPEENRVIINQPTNAFVRMQHDRLGAYLGGPGIVSRALLKEKFSESGIREVSVLSETKLFPYLEPPQKATSNRVC